MFLGCDSVCQVAGGWLLQDSDDIDGEGVELKVVTERKPSEAEIADVRFAWLCVKHVKSNAITIAKVRKWVRVTGLGSPG